ncbi:MAG: ATP-binding protein [Gemmatimonadaceae bacterium]
MSSAPMLSVVAAAVILALLVTVSLVRLAVRPMTLLEKTVDTIWHGDLTVRVPASLLADRHVARVGRMFNILLDSLLADRARTRRLAAELINAGDRERAAMSRELHDSTAQSLAALVMQLSVVAAASASVLYRVAQKAIRNACRHAAAKHIEIHISADADTARLEITDDGIGFDPGAAAYHRTGIGLFTMRERVALIEGELHVMSRVGGGTTVLATVPLRNTDARLPTENSA